MKKYSEAQLEFCRKCLKEAIRFDGRQLLEQRTINFQTNTLVNSNGSCTIYQPLEQINIYVSIKNQVIKQIQPQIKISVQSSQRKYLKDHNQEIQFIQTLLQSNPQQSDFYSKHLTKKKLQIINSKTYSTILLIGVHIFHRVHLALIGIISKSINQALLTCKVPILSCIFNQIQNQQFIDLTQQNTNIYIQTELPRIYLVGVVQNQVIIDPSLMQYEMSNGVVCVQTMSKEIIGHIMIKGQASIEALTRGTRQIKNKLNLK